MLYLPLFNLARSHERIRQFLVGHRKTFNLLMFMFWFGVIVERKRYFDGEPNTFPQKLWAVHVCTPIVALVICRKYCASPFGPQIDDKPFSGIWIKVPSYRASTIPDVADIRIGIIDEIVCKRCGTSLSELGVSYINSGMNSMCWPCADLANKKAS